MRLLFSGDPRAPIAALRLNFNEAGDAPEMGTGEAKKHKTSFGKKT